MAGLFVGRGGGMQKVCCPHPLKLLGGGGVPPLFLRLWFEIKGVENENRKCVKNMFFDISLFEISRVDSTSV